MAQIKLVSLVIEMLVQVKQSSFAIMCEMRYKGRMKASLYVRELSENERTALKSKLQSRDAFELQRSQIILASARQDWRKSPPARRSY